MNRWTKSRFTRILVGLTILCLIVGGGAGPLMAATSYYDSMQIVIPVSNYEITTKNGFDYITLENYGRLNEPGKPNLPSKIFTIAIPHAATIRDVSIDYGNPIELPGRYQIAPSPAPQLIGLEDSAFYRQEQLRYQRNLENIYTQNTAYPDQLGEFLGTAGYREFQLVEVRITPITYNPQKATLLYYPHITVNITYTIPLGASPDISVSESSLLRAEDIILNYDQAKNWYLQTTSRGTDYVIITLDSLVSATTPIKNWEEYKGRTVQIITTSTINSQYSGYDLEERIRNFLTEKYPTSSWGIHDVLFVGDYDDVPMRHTAQNLGYGAPETDFYYAELSLPDDQSWDADGDHQYGEHSDPIDYYAEINVGRIPWSDPETVEYICEKTVAYEHNNSPAYKKNILLLGAFFWDNDPNPKTDTAVLMETKVDQPWMTDWTMTRMYETGYTNYAHDYDLTRSNVISIWSTDNYAFVNWAGHGSPTGCYRYHPSEAFILSDDCPSLNDDFPAIIFADACSNSDTDYLNIGQTMLKQGAVGFVGATKVALGRPGWEEPADGSSQTLDYLFTTAVTSTQYTQGAALQYAITEMYVNGYWSHLKYETFEWSALWGNPNLGMGQYTQNTPPKKPATPTGPIQGEAGISLQFSGAGFDIDNNDIYLKWDWGDGSHSGWQGPYQSGSTIVGNHTWEMGGDFDVKIKIKDILGGMSQWSDPLLVNIGAPVIDIDAPSNGFSPIQFSIKNIGQAIAKQINWTLDVKGGLLGLVKALETGTHDMLSINEQVMIITTKELFGLGPLVIQIEVNAKYGQTTTEQVQGFILGPFILITT